MSNVISIKTIKIGLGVLAVALVLALVGQAMIANAAYTFDRSLKQGMTGDDVMELQKLLNSDADTVVASTGVGSSGSETKYFGSLTKAAVVKFQNKYASEVLTPIGLTSGTGYFGTMSRAKADAILAGGTTTTTPGCQTGDLFSRTTGAACVTTTTPVTTPGCQTGDLFSRTTGAACVTTTTPVTTYPAGCTSATGFSTTTGASCATGVVAGSNTVSLSTDNPATGVIIETQSAADLLHLTFSGTYTVTNLKLNRLGISTSSTLSNVYLFDGNTRLTDAASINSTGEISWNQPSGLFTVTSSRTISVKANVADSMSGQTIGLAFKEAMAGTTAITGTASGNLFSVASNPSTMSTVVFGSVTPTGATINPGANITLWQSSATIGNNDVYLDRIAFRQVGSATTTAFANFKLFVGGVEVAATTGLDSNGYVTFVPTTPVLMSSSRVIRVDADVVSGASRTVQLSLRTAADAGLRDSQLGVNIVATGIPAAAATANTISGTSGGTMTIEKDVSSPSQNLTLNGSDVNIGTFKLTAYGESIKIETLTVGGTFNGTLGTTNDAAVTLRNGRVMIGGTQYGSTSTLAPAGTAFTLNYTVVPGAPVLLEVHSDVYDNDGTGALDASDTLLATIIAGSSNAQRVDSLGTLSVPGTAVSANTLTVATTAMTLSKNGSYANQGTALPAANYKIGSYNLAGSSIEDILLTTLSIDIGTNLVGAGFDYLDVSSLYPVVKNSSGTIVAQPAPIGTVAATNNNFSINYTLAKNTSVTVEFFANLANDGTGTIEATDAFDTVLQVSGFASVSGQTITGGNGTTTVVGQSIAYAAATITVSKDASAPVTAIVYDNQTITTLVAKFAAITAGYNLTDLTVTLGTNSSTVVQSVILCPDATCTTPIASSPMGTSTTAAFSGLSWNVPANASKLLTVKVQLGSIGIGAGTTGSTITTSIAAATDAIYTNTSTGVSTSSSTEEGGTATGSTTYAYASTPTITAQSLPTTILSAGTKTIAKFDVVSNGGAVSWKQVLFDIAKSADPTITAVALWDVTGGGNTLVIAEEVFQNGTGGVATTCSSDNTVCELLISVNTNADDNVEEQVSGTKTYEVRATIGGALSAAESISTSIQSNLTNTTSGVFTSVDNDLTVDDATFVWSDVSGTATAGHDTGTTDWIGENLVRTLPTATWTMTFPSS